MDKKQNFQFYKMKLEDYIINNKLTIIVKPNSSKTLITGYDNNRKALKVNIKEPAENNKANIAVVKLFSKLTGKKVSIVRGLTSKKKILKIID